MPMRMNSEIISALSTALEEIAALNVGVREFEVMGHKVKLNDKKEVIGITTGEWSEKVTHR